MHWQSNLMRLPRPVRRTRHAQPPECLAAIDHGSERGTTGVLHAWAWPIRWLRSATRLRSGSHGVESAARWAYLRRAFAAVICMGVAQSGWAAPGSDDGSPDHPFKLTTGAYRISGGGGQPAGPALDLNLRYGYGSGNVWIGWYRSVPDDFAQTRAGWDHTFDLGWVRVLPSIQIASGGFVGGSFALETGKRWYAGVGLGRTNLRDYANLNFDPNDSYTVYGGYRFANESALSASLVRDNRQHPDQQHVHLVWRSPSASQQRWTLDLLYKQGSIDGDFIRRAGLSLTCDWSRYFMRAAWDPKVNFTPQDMLRLSFGVRF